MPFDARVATPSVLVRTLNRIVRILLYDDIRFVIYSTVGAVLIGTVVALLVGKCTKKKKEDKIT
jgi:predicted permease